MCGIVGELRLDDAAVDPARLTAARDLLTNRGPDDAGLRVVGPIGLGHRRLSIIDLSPAGRMPMSNETDDVWSVFNGEIYNFVALREELERAGHVFKSHTDSEVAIHAYEQWGTDCFAKFDGMFAIAIWDARTRRLVLARDITGEKPLYYAHAPGRFVKFASTIAPLLVGGEIARAIDPESLRSYLELGFVAGDRAIVAGIRKVEPATFVVFDQGKPPVATAYWSLRDAALARTTTPATSLDDATDELHDVLRASVRSRLVSDVPLGAFLSGGVDSSLVVALMAETSARAVRTFTIGFREPEYDESEYAHRVAKHLGVENTTMVLSADEVLRELDAITKAFDEPMADFSALPSLAVARLARRHVTVALTGDGADEAFGGYRYYGATRAFETFARLVPRGIRERLVRAAPLVPYARLRRAIARARAEDPADYFGHSGFYRGATAAQGFHHVVPGAAASPAAAVAAFVRSLPELRPTEAGMLWDASQTLPGAWLTKVDRSTMAVGLEARAPFLARSVLELAFRQPLDHRVRGNQKKILLRRVLSRYLPRDLIDRPKQGFTAPMKAWFAKELREELHDRLTTERMSRLGGVSPDGVQALLAEHEAGRADHTQLLWALFHLDRWYDEYMGSPKARVPGS